MLASSRTVLASFLAFAALVAAFTSVASSLVKDAQHSMTRGAGRPLGLAQRYPNGRDPVRRQRVDPLELIRVRAGPRRLPSARCRVPELDDVPRKV